MKGVLFAATKSGAGKTTLTLALMAAMRQRGLMVAPFKVGPDFIDPGHHSQILGRTSHNLDGWMLSRDYNRRLFAAASTRADVALVEGVMGLFDGYDGRSEAGSSAQMAKWLGLPVVLVVDAGSMARSAAAVVQGFENFDPDLRFAGVVFNNLGSPRHLDYLTQALAGHVRMPCLGGLPRDTDVSIPERHLGLFTAQDHGLGDQQIQRLVRLVEENIDVAALIRALPELPAQAWSWPVSPVGRQQTRTVRIGVARDNAFCFYYQDNLDILAVAGAQLVFFSPVNDAHLPAALDGLYLGGGYPELYAADLAANQSLAEEIHIMSLAGMPIYGECGGFMYLGQSLTDMHGCAHEMSGCLPFKLRMLKRRKALGYREVVLAQSTPIGDPGLTLRGHEFHYSEISEAMGGCGNVYTSGHESDNSRGSEGYLCRNTLGSYLHVHFGSCPDIGQNFVSACSAFKQQRTASQALKG